MTKYLKNIPFSGSSSGDASKEQWESTFGKHEEMRCSKGCAPEFTRVEKDNKLVWVCKRCGECQ